MKLINKYIINKGVIHILGETNPIMPSLIALSIFICFMGVVSSHFFFICWILVCFYCRRNVPIDSSFRMMIVIISLSFMNEILGITFNSELVMNSVFELIPYSLLILFTIYTAKIINERILRWLIVFTILDVIVAIYQRIIGVNSFFSSTVSEMGDLLFYDMSVNGLHINSAGLGESVFLGLLIYEKYYQSRIVKGYVFYPLICIGAFLCFNRTTMVVLAFFFVLKAYKENKLYIVFFVCLGIVTYILMNKELLDILFMQFFRGADSLDSGNAVSERDVIYPFYWNFFKENFFLGNNSFKYYVQVFGDGRMFHAHNSYLQTLANNGFIISLLYFILIFKNINRDNYYLILPILLFACFQTFILWGLSYGDLIFYNILLDKQKYTNNEKIFQKRSLSTV